MNSSQPAKGKWIVGILDEFRPANAKVLRRGIPPRITILTSGPDFVPKTFTLARDPHGMAPLIQRMTKGGFEGAFYFEDEEQTKAVDFAIPAVGVPVEIKRAETEYRWIGLVDRTAPYRVPLHQFENGILKEAIDKRESVALVVDPCTHQVKDELWFKSRPLCSLQFVEPDPTVLEDLLPTTSEVAGKMFDYLMEFRTRENSLRCTGCLDFRKHLNDCIPFCYPDDKCFDRAHVSCHLLAEKFPEHAGALLKYRVGLTSTFCSPNDPEGSRFWQSHIAPAVRIGRGGNEALVLDPSLFCGPVPLQVWLERLQPVDGLETWRMLPAGIHHESSRGWARDLNLACTYVGLEDARNWLEYRVRTCGKWPPYHTCPEFDCLRASMGRELRRKHGG